jgi:hypothetical protein
MRWPTNFFFFTSIVALLNLTGCLFQKDSTPVAPSTQVSTTSTSGGVTGGSNELVSTGQSGISCGVIPVAGAASPNYTPTATISRDSSGNLNLSFFPASDSAQPPTVVVPVTLSIGPLGSGNTYPLSFIGNGVELDMSSYPDFAGQVGGSNCTLTVTTAGVSAANVDCYGTIP